MQNSTDAAHSLDASPWRWHLVFTKPGRECDAQINLERQGYRVYFPRMRQKILRSGTWRETICAVFPRYLFVQLNAAVQSLAPIRSTSGVANLVRFGTEYVPVPESVVNDLIGHEDAAGLHRLSIGTLFKFGSAVRVIEGALAGLEGIFEHEDANDRITILLNMLGRETRIKLPVESVTPIGLLY